MSAPAIAHIAAPSSAQTADGACAITGEILPVGFTAIRGDHPGDPKRRYQYRDHRLVAIEHATGATPTRREVFEYDAYGRLTETHEASLDAFDSVNTRREVDTYRYRDTPTGVAISELRAGGETVECALDRGGRTLTCDGHNDGVGAWSSTRRYDAQARLIGESIDYATSTSSNLRMVRTYDDAARAMTETRDFDGDGTIDAREATTYNADGRVIAVQGSGPSATAALVHWTNAITYRLDGAGRVACATTIRTADAQPTTTETRCFDHDAAGNVTRITRTSDAPNDQPDHPPAIESMTYDGRFRAMTCGHLARPDDLDDADSTEARQIWDDQIRVMLHD